MLPSIVSVALMPWVNPDPCLLMLMNRDQMIANAGIANPRGVSIVESAYITAVSDKPTVPNASAQ